MTNSTGFAFVNITNPEEAKSVSNRRKVRQHVRYKKTSTDSKAAKVKQACETSPKQKRNAILEAGNSSRARYEVGFDDFCAEAGTAEIEKGGEKHCAGGAKKLLM